MWIFSCGPRRSGSTLQFNIIREILERSSQGIVIDYCFPDQFESVYEKHKDVSSYKLFKTHELTPFMIKLVKTKKALCISCYRDLRDVVVSVGKKEDLPFKKLARSDKMVKNYIEYYNLIKNLKGSYISKYERFYSNILEESRNILKFLDINLTEEELVDINNQLSYKNREELIDHEKMISFKGRNEKNYVLNKKTLMHHDHFNNIHPNSFINDLSKKDIYEIEKRGGLWLILRGYKVSILGLIANIKHLL